MWVLEQVIKELDPILRLLAPPHILQMVVDMVEIDLQETIQVVRAELVVEEELIQVVELLIQEDQQINLQVDHLLGTEILEEPEDIKVV